MSAFGVNRGAVYYEPVELGAYELQLMRLIDRKQLAFYQERKIKPRRADNPTRLTLVALSRWFNWRDASDRRKAQDVGRLAA